MIARHLAQRHVDRLNSVGRVHGYSRLFAEGCRRSCEASSNDMEGGFELPAIRLWSFTVVS